MMPAALHLVTAGQLAPAGEAARVLSSDFVIRLQAANTAQRNLRSMGYRVLDVVLAGGDRPMVLIERRSDLSLSPLLDAALVEDSTHRPWWADDRISKVGHVRYCGALIRWRELT